MAQPRRLAFRRNVRRSASLREALGAVVLNLTFVPALMASAKPELTLMAPVDNVYVIRLPGRWRKRRQRTGEAVLGIRDVVDHEGRNE